MLLILPPGGKLIIQDQVSGMIAYAPLFGLRAVSLCFLILRLGGKLIIQDQVSFIWPSGGKFMLPLSASGRESYFTRPSVRQDSLWFFILPPGGKFMLLILLSGGKLFIQDQVSERIAYASLFCLRAVSLCF